MVLGELCRDTDAHIFPTPTPLIFTMKFANSPVFYTPLQILPVITLCESDLQNVHCIWTYFVRFAEIIRIVNLVMVLINVPLSRNAQTMCRPLLRDQTSRPERHMALSRDQDIGLDV